MKQIKFSHNWNNKLHNDVFTTIRKFTPDKHKYYRESIGDTFQVMLKNEALNYVNLAKVKQYNYCDIDRHILALDLGTCNQLEQDEIFKLFGCDKEIIVLTFKKIN